MRDILDQLMRYVRGIWRYRWYIHLVAWPLCLAGWFMVAKLPNEFEASARVHVDTQSTLRPLLRGLAIQTEVGSEVEVMTKTLLSRPNLEKVMRMTDMDLKAKTPAEMDDAIDTLQKKIHFQGGGRTNLYKITYTDATPELAKGVVQSLLTIFVESMLGDSRKDSNSAQKFLDEQIRDYEQRLYEAEERLKNFKRKNVALMPSRGEDYFSQLNAEQKKLAAAKLELEEVVRRRDELKRQLAGEEPTLGMMPSTNTFTGAVVHPLDGRIHELENRLEDLKLRYTDKHPDVIGVQETLNRLKAQRDKEIAEARKDSPNSAQQISNVDQNPVYQQIKISLGEAEAEAASLTARVDRLQKSVKNFEEMVDTIPKIEAEMSRLNRDYSINKKNYEALLARRESAKLAQSAEQSSDDIQFKIIDPPRAPTEPSGPNRLLFDSVILLGGFVAGLAFAFFLSQVKPTFDSQDSLSQSTGFPVLGSVSIVRTPKQIKLRLVELGSFVVVGLILMTIFAAIISMQFSAAALLGSHSGAL